jgi:hypothetical protein
VCLRPLVKQKTDRYAPAGATTCIYLRPATTHDSKEHFAKTRGARSQGTFSRAGLFNKKAVARDQRDLAAGKGAGAGLAGAGFAMALDEGGGPVGGSVDDGADRHVGDALLGAEPAELRVAHHASGEPADLPDEARRVMDAFVADGRLTAIPVARAKRLVVLDWLAQEFEPGRRYSEAMVNLIIGRRHPDTAALRRYLVDEDFLSREAGQYWRSGGSIES